MLPLASHAVEAVMAACMAILMLAMCRETVGAQVIFWCRNYMRCFLASAFTRWLKTGDTIFVVVVWNGFIIT